MSDKIFQKQCKSRIFAEKKITQIHWFALCRFINLNSTDKGLIKNFYVQVDSIYNHFQRLSLHLVQKRSLKMKVAWKPLLEVVPSVVKLTVISFSVEV